MDHLYLVGYMGCGKTTLGPLVARALGCPFVDLDRAIEAEAGRPIPELFATEGEAGFRVREAAMLARLAAGPRQVVATGGGVVLDAANRALLRATGIVVALDAPVEELARRVAGSGRPLAADPGAFLARYQERRPRYAAFGAMLEAVGEPEAIARRLVTRYQAQPQQQQVELGARSYPLILEPGGLGRLGEHMARQLRPGPCLLVTNPTVAGLYLEAAEQSLAREGWRPTVVQVPDGEEAKAIAPAAMLWDAMAAAGMDRRSPVVALGGGVVGDLAGFAAATYMRGVPLVQVPTTLLAQLDSSVGGKVAINHPRGKNLVGAFHQPSLVLADPLTLLTLPGRELRGGLAELAKMGVIRDAELFAALEARRAVWLDGELAGRVAAIHRACELKAAIVAADERESGERALLNFGHTVGHAIEAVTGYARYRHGEAVAVGMLAAARLARRLGLLADDTDVRLEAWAVATELPCDLAGLEAEALLAAMRLDKKAEAGRLVFVLPTRMGEARIVPDLPESDVRSVLLDLGARS